MHLACVRACVRANVFDRTVAYSWMTKFVVWAETISGRVSVHATCKVKNWRSLSTPTPFPVRVSPSRPPLPSLSRVAPSRPPLPSLSRVSPLPRRTQHCACFPFIGYYFLLYSYFPPSQIIKLTLYYHLGWPILEMFCSKLLLGSYCHYTYVSCLVWFITHANLS